jgi:choline kinase
MAGSKIALIVLAAGKGTRLRPLTDNMPKCLVPVAGKSIFVHTLESLEALQKKHGLSISVFPVTGFKAELVDELLEERKTPLTIRVLSNKDYDTTNNLYSLRLAMDAVRAGDFDRIIWANGDCIYDTAILETAMTTDKSGILCDSKYPYNDESMKIATDNGRILAISKTIPAGSGSKVSIDCYSFTAKAWTTFESFIKAYCVGPKLNMWAEIALNDFMVRENAKEEGGIPLTPIDIDGLRWMEIDNAHDLAQAEKLWTK